MPVVNVLQFLHLFRRKSPTLEVTSSLHSITIKDTVGGGHVRLMVLESTFPGLEDIPIAAEFLRSIITNHIEATAMAELRQRSSAGTLAGAFSQSN